jgi:hypothetical protein
MTAAIEKPSWPWWAVAGGLGVYYFSKYFGVKQMQEILKELEETRSARDAAVATAGQAMVLVASLTALEKLLRGKLKAVEDALKKEREDSMEAHHKNFEARQNLEKANEDWKRKHADLEARCAELEAKLKEKKVKVPAR